MCSPPFLTVNPLAVSSHCTAPVTSAKKTCLNSSSVSPSTNPDPRRYTCLNFRKQPLQWRTAMAHVVMAHVVMTTHLPLPTPPSPKPVPHRHPCATQQVTIAALWRSRHVPYLLERRMVPCHARLSTNIDRDMTSGRQQRVQPTALPADTSLILGHTHTPAQAVEGTGEGAHRLGHQVGADCKWRRCSFWSVIASALHCVALGCCGSIP